MAGNPNPHQNHPSCVELRLLMSRHNLQKVQLAEEAAMSVASVSQYCRGSRVPNLRVLTTLRDSIESLAKKQAADPRRAEARRKERIYLTRFQEKIMRTARAQGWIAWYFHDDNYNPLGIIMIREIIFVALLRTKRRAAPESHTVTRDALAAAGLNEPPLPQVARQHSKVAVWDLSPEQWPAIERILTHPAPNSLNGASPGPNPALRPGKK